MTLFPGMLDIWRLPLDGSGKFERLTTFDYYEGYGANNPLVSPDGTQIAFGLKVEGEEGRATESCCWTSQPPATAAGNTTPPAPRAPPTSRVAAGAKSAELPATGSNSKLPVSGALVALAILIHGLCRAIAEQLPRPNRRL